MFLNLQAASIETLMIITKKKDINAILESLKGKKTVFLFGCNSCAEQCATGGEKEIKEMTAILEEARDKGRRLFHSGRDLLQAAHP